MTKAQEIVKRLLEADPDDVDVNFQRQSDAYAETRGFDDGAAAMLQRCRSAYKKLEADGVIERMTQDWVKRHARTLDDDDIAQGIVWMVLDSSGLYGPDWVHKWFRKYAGGRFF